MRSADSLTYRELLSILQEAIRQFNENETYLIDNDLSERCINSKLAMYVERVLEEWEIDGRMWMLSITGGLTGADI